MSYRLPFSTYANGSNSRAAGTQFQVPTGLDTSEEISLTVTGTTDGTNLNPVLVNLYVTQIPTGATLNTADVTETLYTMIFTPTGTANDVLVAVTDIDVRNLQPRETLAFRFNPQRSTDTNTDDFRTLNFRFSGIFFE